MSLPLRVRFLVLNRDSFTCRYCGAKAPDVELEVDHVIPVSRGGTNDMENLVTSCRPCNAGKSAVLIDELQGFCTHFSDHVGPPCRLNGYTMQLCGGDVYRVIDGNELCRRHFARITKIYPVLRHRYPHEDVDELWFRKAILGSAEEMREMRAWEERAMGALR